MTFAPGSHIPSTHTLSSFPWCQPAFTCHLSWWPGSCFIFLCAVKSPLSYPPAITVIPYSLSSPGIIEPYKGGTIVISLSHETFIWETPSLFHYSLNLLFSNASLTLDSIDHYQNYFLSGTFCSLSSFSFHYTWKKLNFCWLNFFLSPLLHLSSCVLLVKSHTVIIDVTLNLKDKLQP